eukprot:SAG11_NODE_7837_length_1090_cov_1.638749_2_plen_46_part_01
MEELLTRNDPKEANAAPPAYLRRFEGWEEASAKQRTIDPASFSRYN